MRNILTRPGIRLWTAFFVVFLLCCLSQPATAANSWLAIRQANGHDWLYALNEIEQITYGTNELHVTTAQRTDTYALDEILRVDYIPETTTVGVDGPGGRPSPIDPSHLFQNFPNPFSPETQIAFNLPRAGSAQIRIYDVKGRLVRELMDESRPAGPHTVMWDGRDDSGSVAPAGVYFYSLKAPGVDENRRMILVK